MNRVAEAWYDLGLYRRAHRVGPGLALLAGLPVSAVVASGATLRLPTLTGAVAVPWVCLPGVLVGAVLVWMLEPRTPWEGVSTRPLRRRALLAVWAAVLLPALALVALGPSTSLYARAALFTTGLTVACWRGTGSPMSAVVPVVWFAVTTAVSRSLPGAVWWAVYTVRGDARTWALPVLAALVALGPTRPRHSIR